jgi:outer membrane protein OmpA-like peptidoglycan-associated protein
MKKAGFLALPAVILVPLIASVASVASAQGTVTFGAGANAGANAAPSGASAGGVGGASAGGVGGAGAAARRPEAAPAAPAAPLTPEKEWEERDRKMDEAATLTGGVGLVHTQHAQGGAVGQFRVGFTSEWFSESGFLCTATFPCRNPSNPSSTGLTNDKADHIGGHLTLSMQVLSWLEPYLSTSAIGNSNDRNRPQLLQVLGDSTLGAKAYGRLNNVFSLGGAFELWLVNGTGTVGLDGGGTSAKFRGLATADLRGAEKRIPLRFSANMTYVLDNTGQVVEETEKARGVPITRIERFGLNVNRVDHFDIHLGGEFFASEEKVRPFLEYNVAIPVNRQDYLCRPNNPSRDKCLANEQVAPSSLTLGGSFYPWKRGFNVRAALDIGLSGVGNFIEEVRPTPPWMLYVGAGWAFDTKDRPPVVREVIVDRPVATKAPGRKIRGFVHEEGTTQAVVNAIVTWDNHPDLTALATGNDGRFLTHDLDEGNYVFGLRADGYKPGQCTTTIVRPVGLYPASPASPAPAPGAPPAPPAPAFSGEIQLDCPLQALPRVGTIVGKVRDMESSAPIAATIRVVDVAKKELNGSSDAMGGFRFELVTPGEAQVTADAEGYLASTEKVDIKPRQDNTFDIQLKKRPKNANVTVGKGEIVIKQQIQFAVDSAVILPTSNGLLTEIADALIKSPRIRKVEVQGHTDNTGTPEHNKQLSDDRASAVVAWLTSHGVAADRLAAKGFGQTKPLVPNVTAANRGRNRRVQFIIVDQDAASAAPGAKPRGL